MTQTGDLRQRIVLRQLVKIRNSQGGSKPSMQTITGCESVPAKIQYDQPRMASQSEEPYKQQQLQPKVAATFTIRYRPGVNISAAVEVGYGNRIFDIRSISTDDEKQQWITIRAEERQAKGTLKNG
jgi:SPP1 family predicted phage head-tail adaptor